MLTALALAVIAKHDPIHVEGNRLVADGKPVTLHAVVLPGLETAEGGDNVFRSMRVAAEDWKANCVVIPLSQDRWAGKIKGEKQHGEEYRGAVDDLLTYVQKSGIYAIVQLASSDEGTWGQNMGPHNMPDKNSEEFWRQMARRYGGYENVLFDLYAEPQGVMGIVWLLGGQVIDGTATYQTPGIRNLVDDVRKSGATNVIVLNGLNGVPLEEAVGAKDVGHGRGLVFETWRSPFMEDDMRPPFSRLIDREPMLSRMGPRADRDFDFASQHHMGWVSGVMAPGTYCRSLIKDWQYTPTEEGEALKTRLAGSAN